MGASRCLAKSLSGSAELANLSCNELNASYAAEAFARVNGCGAVVATINVGSFSALNGVAGAYAERLPVIFVASGYNTNDASASHLLHHSLGTHDFLPVRDVQVRDLRRGPHRAPRRRAIDDRSRDPHRAAREQARLHRDRLQPVRCALPRAGTV